MTTARDEIQALARSSTFALDRALRKMARANVTGVGEVEAFREVRRLIFQTLALGDLLGRRRLLLEVEAVSGATFGHVGDVGHFGLLDAIMQGARNFGKAIKSILKRRPVLAEGHRAAARAHSEGSFALAKSATLQVTKRVQKSVAELTARGTPPNLAGKVVADIGNWSRAYGDTVFRTNLNTAYTAGRVSVSRQPVVRTVAPAFKYQAVGGASGDGDNRNNHLAAHGLIAGVEAGVWDGFTPPLGYNCRCSLRPMTRRELDRLGLLNDDGSVTTSTPGNFSAAHADSPSFGRRGRF